jgi:hypothetical protein
MAFRGAILGVLIGLYLVHPFAGLIALIGGAAYGVWHRSRRETAFE